MSYYKLVIKYLKNQIYIMDTKKSLSQKTENENKQQPQKVKPLDN